MNPCCCFGCGLKCGVRSIALFLMVLACFWIIYYSILIYGHALEAEHRLEVLLEEEASNITSNITADYSNVAKVSTYSTESDKMIRLFKTDKVLKEKTEAIIGNAFLLLFCILDFILALVLLCGANHRKTGLLKCWMVITIILQVARILSLIENHKDVKSWVPIGIGFGISAFCLFVVFCYIKEIKKYPNGIKVAQGEIGMPVQPLPNGTGYQQMPVPVDQEQKQQADSTDQPTN